MKTKGNCTHSQSWSQSQLQSKFISPICIHKKHKKGYLGLAYYRSSVSKLQSIVWITLGGSSEWIVASFSAIDIKNFFQTNT